jgi:hypothetical protein
MKSKHIIILLAAFTLLFACQAEEKPIPNELLGVWQTSEPKYDGCFFKIGENSIIFLNKYEPSIDSNIISKIEIVPPKGDKHTLYTIYYYKEGEEEYQFSFYYYPEEGGSILFKNQIEIKWQKTDDQDIKKLFTVSG